MYLILMLFVCACSVFVSVQYFISFSSVVSSFLCISMFQRNCAHHILYSDSQMCVLCMKSNSFHSNMPTILPSEYREICLLSKRNEKNFIGRSQTMCTVLMYMYLCCTWVSYVCSELAVYFLCSYFLSPHYQINCV